MTIIISILLWILAAGCNAVMDTLVHHYYISVFNSWKYDSKYWNPAISWTNKYINNDPSKGLRKILWGLMDYPVFLTDGWHLFKSLMIVFICASMAMLFYSGQESWFGVIVIFIGYGVLWNVVFNLFYNKILRR